MIAIKTELFQIFENLNIENKTYYHDPLFTVDQALKVASTIAGSQCKNLFLKDSKNNLYLVVALHNTKIELKKLSKYLKAPELRFASAELLKNFLGVEPGSVTPFGLLYDREHKVIVLLDAQLFESAFIGFHPLENNATTVIKSNDLIKFIEYCNNEFQILNFNHI